MGQLCNSEPLRQGRHRGKTGGALRDASEAELTEVRAIARAMIESYLRYLESSTGSMTTANVRLSRHRWVPSLLRCSAHAQPQRLTRQRTPMKPQSTPLTKVKFIEPMYARLVNKLPEGKEWLYEVKFDGYRCLAGRHAKGVTLWSRRGNLFTKQFPHIARACEHLPPVGASTAENNVDKWKYLLDIAAESEFCLLESSSKAK